jgi:hypothetical protein
MKEGRKDIDEGKGRKEVDEGRKLMKAGRKAGRQAGRKEGRKGFHRVLIRSHRPPHDGKAEEPPWRIAQEVPTRAEKQ